MKKTILTITAVLAVLLLAGCNPDSLGSAMEKATKNIWFTYDAKEEVKETTNQTVALVSELTSSTNNVQGANQDDNNEQISEIIEDLNSIYEMTAGTARNEALASIADALKTPVATNTNYGEKMHNVLTSFTDSSIGIISGTDCECVNKEKMKDILDDALTNFVKTSGTDKIVDAFAKIWEGDENSTGLGSYYKTSPTDTDNPLTQAGVMVNEIIKDAFVTISSAGDNVSDYMNIYYSVQDSMKALDVITGNRNIGDFINVVSENIDMEKLMAAAK